MLKDIDQHKLAEKIVKYIKDNPGCIKEMYLEEDWPNVHEEHLLNVDDWFIHEQDLEDDGGEYGPLSEFIMQNESPMITGGCWNESGDEWIDSGSCWAAGFQAHFVIGKPDYIGYERQHEMLPGIWFTHFEEG